MKKILSILSAAVLVLAACQPETPEAEAVKVKAITLNPASLQVIVGQTQTITATVAPSNATDKTLEWSVDKPAIATVDQQGVVTGVAEGEAIVTVKSKDGSGAKQTCKVTVIPESAGILVTAITLTEAGPLSMAPGDEVAVEAVVDPKDATNKEVDWVFSAREVAKYENGKVIALAEGTTELKAVAKDGSKVESAPLSITVKAPAPMFAKYKKITLRVGQNLAASTAVWAYFGSEDDYSNREDLENPVWTSDADANVVIDLTTNLRNAEQLAQLVLRLKKISGVEAAFLARNPGHGERASRSPG